MTTLFLFTFEQGDTARVKVDLDAAVDEPLVGLGQDVVDGSNDVARGGGEGAGVVHLHRDVGHCLEILQRLLDQQLLLEGQKVD